MPQGRLDFFAANMSYAGRRCTGDSSVWLKVLTTAQL